MLGEADTEELFPLKNARRILYRKSSVLLNMLGRTGRRKLFLLKMLNGAGIKIFFY